jgi:RHS repeat-associated protein
MVSKDAYYPFGMRIAGLSETVDDPDPRYKYNGKELDEEKGLNWLAYGARYYDPEIGRWHVVDPVDQFWSGYTYGPGDPINGNDPDGMVWVILDDYSVVWLDDPGVTVIADRYGVSEAEFLNNTWDDFSISGPYITDYYNTFMGPSGGLYVTEWVYDAYEYYPVGKTSYYIPPNPAIYPDDIGLLIMVTPIVRGLSAASGAELAGGAGAAKESSRILNMTTNQLQTKFNHAADFGVTGNWNKAAAGKFSSAINQHINSPGVKIIHGTYHRQPAVHYLNPNTGLNVISRPNGQFWSGWKLSPEQLQNVMQHGGL